MASYSEVFCVCLLISLVWFLPTLTAQSCLSDCFARMNEFTECPVFINGSVDSSLSLKFITTPSSNSNSYSLIISLVLALLCNHGNSQLGVWSSTESAPPYCAVLFSQEERDCGNNDECNNNINDNCTYLNLSISDQWTNSSVPQSLISTTLSLDSSRIALALYGLVYVEENILPPIEGLSNTGVPIASWVCLGVGVVISTLTLLKPIWWDRVIVRIKRRLTK